MPTLAGSSGLKNFIKKHGLWDEDQNKSAMSILKRIQDLGLESIRLSFADQHGLLRGKSILVAELESILSSGCSMTSTLLLKDTSNRTVFPIWEQGAGMNASQFNGAGDMIMVPDPKTFKVLPWSKKTGWFLCDIYFPNGDPIPFSSRALCSQAVDALYNLGYEYLSGIEIEFHIFKTTDPKLGFQDSAMPGTAPEVAPLAHGFQYLSEVRLDELEPAIDLIREGALALDLPLRTVEIEFGPSQVEFTFSPLVGKESADLMLLFRSATKQICKRSGYHASFMCRPGLQNVFASGWHLHQSLVNRSDGKNAFASDKESLPLSNIGSQFVAGILKNADASCIFTTPTINGYKRYKPESLAPDRILWAKDNRGAMVRVLGSSEDQDSRIENRVGDPGANPYFYLMSQILSGLDGIENKLIPPPITETPYTTNADRLPQSLMEAADAFDRSSFYRTKLGDEFVEYLLKIKRNEINRFLSEVTDWEHREYFEIL